MEHIGIDLGASHSHLVILTSEGEQERMERVRTSQLELWLSARERARVVMEACTQSPAVSAAARAAGHETFVIPGQLVRALGVGARGIKTDERDALVLAQASFRIENLPSVHQRSSQSVAIRELLSTRHALLKSRSALSSKVKSWLRGQLIAVKGRANSVYFAEKVRALCTAREQGLPYAIEVLLRSYEQLCHQLDELEEVLETYAVDDTNKRLKSVPGVGPLTALAFISQLDDPHRFGSADELGSYLALTPGEQTTGGKVKRTGTLKSGPRYLKSLLVQCAWTALRHHPHEPMVQWAKAIADRRGKRIAVVALARKLATVMWALWRDGSAYNANLASSWRASAA